MEVNILKLNSRTLNSGHIFFDDQKLAKKWREAIDTLKIGCSEVVYIKKGKVYYGFRMFCTKKHVMKLGEKLKEVLTIE